MKRKTGGETKAERRNNKERTPKAAVALCHWCAAKEDGKDAAVLGYIYVLCTTRPCKAKFQAVHAVCTSILSTACQGQNDPLPRPCRLNWATAFHSCGMGKDHWVTGSARFTRWNPFLGLWHIPNGQAYPIPAGNFLPRTRNDFLREERTKSSGKASLLSVHSMQAIFVNAKFDCCDNPHVTQRLEIGE